MNQIRRYELIINSLLLGKLSERIEEQSRREIKNHNVPRLELTEF